MKKYNNLTVAIKGNNTSTTYCSNCSKKLTVYEYNNSDKCSRCQGELFKRNGTYINNEGNNDIDIILKYKITEGR